MPDYLLILLLLGVAVAYAWRAQTRRVAVMRRAEALGEAAREAKVGPIPGYSYLPGSAIRWDPRDPPPRGLGERWRVLSVETLHLFGPRGLRRARLVLRIAHEALEDTDLVQLARELAGRLARRMRVQVVAVQAESPRYEGDEAVLIYAPDGRGWTGMSEGAELSIHIPGREAFRL